MWQVRDPEQMTTQRDIRFALLLDQLEARIAAAEATVAELRAQHDDLRALRDAEVDDAGEASEDREWLGYALVEQAIAMLRPRSGEPSPGA